MTVLELAGGSAAGFAGLVLAELGFDVLRIEPPTGAHTDVDDATRAFLSRGKRRVELNLHTRTGVESMLRLVDDGEALIEDLGPGALGRLRLSARRLRRMRPPLVIASISPFGQTGPRQSWQATELVLQAMGGILHATGWEGEPPLKLAGQVAAHIAGLHAALAVCAAVYGVRSGNEAGVHIDISAQEAFLQHWSRHIGQWTYNGIGARRDTRTFEGQGVPHTANVADGWLCLAMRNARWNTVAELFGLEAFAGDEWQTAPARAERWPEIRPHFNAALAARTRQEWFDAASQAGLIVGPVQDLHEVLGNEHYAARDYFTSVEIGGRSVACPGLPFKWED